MTTAIQKHDGGAVEEQDWTHSREKVEVFKRGLCPSGITDAELSVFLQQCRARGLDPFAGDVFCVARRTNVGTKDAPKWITAHVLQASVAGMRSRAERYGDLVANDGEAVYERDVCKVDRAAGSVVHIYEPTKPRGALKGAWARVERKGRKPVVIWLDVGSRTPSGPVYANNAGEHLAKCAEAAAFRKAYPTAYAGLYVSEETPPEREPSKVEEALSGAPAEPPPSLPEPKPTLEFGEWKGRPLETLVRTEALAALEQAREKLAAPIPPAAKWPAKLRAQVVLLEGYLATLPPDEASLNGEPSESEKAAIRAQEMEQAEPGTDG